MESEVIDRNIKSNAVRAKAQTVMLSYRFDERYMQEYGPQRQQSIFSLCEDAKAQMKNELNNNIMVLDGKRTELFSLKSHIECLHQNYRNALDAEAAAAAAK